MHSECVFFRFVEGVGLQMVSEGAQTHMRFDSIVSVNKFGEYGV